MPDLAPTVPPKQTAAPAPMRRGTPPKAPATRTDDQQPSAPASVPSPIESAPVTAVAKVTVVPQPAPQDVSGPAPSAKSEISSPAAFVQEKAVAPVSTAAEIATPVNVLRQAIQAPAPRVEQRDVVQPYASPSPDRVMPSPYRSLLSFEDLESIVAAIGKAKERAGEVGGRFAWSRGAGDPEIVLSDPLKSLEELTEAVFEQSSRSDFKAEELLTEAIATLPNSLVKLAKQQQLEGVWIEFPNRQLTAADSETTAAQTDKQTRLAIAISITLPEPSPQLGPLSAHRIYLKFGDALW